jgi:hypothetical protein
MSSQRLQEHPRLSHVSLEDSYVLGWQAKGDALSIDLDVVLLPSHPVYSQPTVDEWACFKRGTLTFSRVTKLSGLDRLNSSRPARDAAGEADFGHIEDATYNLDGDYKITIELAGDLSFSAGEIGLVLGVA